MSNSANDAVLAVLAELEAQALKKGKKSIVKGVLRRLRDRGASAQLLGEISALNGKKSNGAASAATKAKAAPKTKTQARAKRDASALSASKAKVQPEFSVPEPLRRRLPARASREDDARVLERTGTYPARR